MAARIPFGDIKPCMVCEQPSMYSGCVLCGMPVRGVKPKYCSEECAASDWTVIKPRPVVATTTHRRKEGERSNG